MGSDRAHAPLAAPRPSARRAVTAMLGVVLAAAGLSLTGPVAPATGAARGGVELKVATYNVIAGASATTFRDAVNAIAPRAHIVGLQEVNSADKERVLKGMAGWSYVRRKAANQEPVMWRSDRFRLVKARAPRLSGKRYIGSERPDAGRWRPSKHVAVVRLKDRWTGRRVSVVNVHLVAGAVKGGTGRPDRPRLFDLYKDQVRRLAEVAKREERWGKVFVLGDFNISWRPDSRERKRPLPFATFRRIDMRSMWATETPAERGTRGTALLDQVYSRSKASDAAVQFDITFSDHLPAVATYHLAKG